jgi:hypothetical protein
LLFLLEKLDLHTGTFELLNIARHGVGPCRDICHPVRGMPCFVSW